MEEESQVVPKKQRTMRDNYIIVAIMIAIVAVLGIGVSFYVKNISYSEFEVLSTLKTTDSADTKYIYFKDKLLKYSMDGASYLDAKGKPIWSEAYNIRRPQISASENYVAVGDIGGNTVYLFSEKGKIINYDFEYPIANFEVANQGVVVAKIENGVDSVISMRDKNGDAIIDLSRPAETSGFPLDLGLSPDGEKLVISYLTIDGIKSQNTLAFHNFAIQEAAIGTWNGSSFGDTVFPQLEFLDNDTLCAFGDDRIVIYAMRNRPSIKAEIKIESEIKSVFYSRNYIGVITMNSGAEVTESYMLNIYSLTGKPVLKKGFSVDYKSAKFDGNDIILIGDHECSIYNTNGNQKFYASFGKSITDIIPTGKRNQYLIADTNETKLIKLK